MRERRQQQRRRRRLAQRAGEETGVVLVLVAIMMVVFLGMAALAIDIGSFYVSQRHAQTAADAAALAAAQDLSRGTTAIGTDITTMARTNDPDLGTVTYTTGYGGAPNAVKVTVSAVSPSYFGNVLGISHADVSASAVAGASSASSAAPTAVFAKDTSCGGGVTVNGANTNVIGGVHSNGGIMVNSSNTDWSASSYGGPNNCNVTVNGANERLGTPTRDPSNEPWPVDYSTMTRPAPPETCDFTASSFTWSSANATIPAGTYCATSGDINISGANITADGCTFVAEQGKIVVSGPGFTSSGNLFANGENGQIDFSGSNLSFDGVFESTGQNGQIDFNQSAMSGTATMIANAFQFNRSNVTVQPYPGLNNLLYYQTGSQTLDLDGSNYAQGGNIFVPNASVVINTANNKLTGMIEAQDITFTGANETITGDGPPLAGGASSMPSLLQ